MKIKVENMRSSKGTIIANQFIIRTDDKCIFQSYSSIIAEVHRDGKVYLDKGLWDYSVTTSKYRNLFLMEDTKTTKAKIKSGEYILTSLNQEGI